MKKILLLIALAVNSIAHAADAEIDWHEVKINLSNQASLQRGAKYFMNYCSGCHSLKYLRYSQMAKGLGLITFDGSIAKDLLMNNLVFTKATVYDPIEIAMPREDAEQWFGRMPPDLTLSAREKGANWIYTYLKSFYKDESRPFGSNNRLVPDVSMPNILAPLQGEVIALNPDQSNDPSHLKLALVEQGIMTQQQFDSMLQDLVNFLVYAAEPNLLKRYTIGSVVIAFLIILAVFAYLLKRVYWKKIH
ncbi:cytochrome c [Legionella impletisoli]|uniref:Cytochrome c n=2 Tax=Legionella impletisoli TaxID=343510 RepID=A0A917JTE6_9GAMM|nr:cytochrome c [Legionella impletisoli]